MAMTERQGGSDVRANITRAHPVGDDVYEIHGHKWFCSYPPCDVFLVLAQAPGGLSCFLIERADGGMEFQRLKDKLGTRSLPSSEVEFHGARGRLIGEEGRGVPAIIKMVNHTRFDCLLGGATGLRRGTVEAIHHARHRSAFGKLLAERELAAGADARLDAHMKDARERAAQAFQSEDPQFQARRVVEDLAVALQASLLVREAPPAVADAFCATRLAGQGGRAYGTLPAGVDARAIIERALPT